MYLNCFLLLAASSVNARNMNGVPGQYKIANGLATTKPFNTDYTAEYFEVYSTPIRTLYSEVFWKGLPPIPLPTDVMNRFHNKTMAVVGYEVDQVQVTAGVNGSILEEKSVPITHTYNHHYCAWLVNSKKARLRKTKASENMIRSGQTHGSEHHWVAESLLLDDPNYSNDGNGTPQVQFFSEGNGGEFRMSYHGMFVKRTRYFGAIFLFAYYIFRIAKHGILIVYVVLFSFLYFYVSTSVDKGYPRGYAQLIESPDTFRLVPMMIDTFNRDALGTEFMPGPLPKSSQIPSTAGFSGLLECPCSDRIEKIWNMTYVLQDTIAHTCGTPVQSQQECFESVSHVVQSSDIRLHGDFYDTSLPDGCSLIQQKDGTTDVYWNVWSSDGSYLKNEDYAKKINTKLAMELQHKDVRVKDSFSTEKNDMVAFAAGQVNVTVAVQQPGVDQDDATDAVIIMIVGPPDKWFGVGFGSDTMCNHMQSDECPDGGPYAIVIQGDHVEERQLGYHGPGTAISNTTSTSSSHLKIHRNEIVGDNRTVVLTRSRHGGSFTFDTVNTPTLDIITAQGCGMPFAQHCGHGTSQLNFVATEKPTRICQAGIAGTIQGRKFWEQNRCQGSLAPKDGILNPTCKIETYRGGLYCCNHGQYLLDSDQEIPWKDQYLEYQLKFRFYFEEYEPPVRSQAKHNRPPDTLDIDYGITQPGSHLNLARLYWVTEGNPGEYDILQCNNNTPPSQCVQMISSRIQVKQLLHDCDTHPDGSWCTGSGSTDPEKTEGIQIIYAGPHCHAPSCLSMELYNANTGQLLCRVEPIYGKSEEEIFDEKNYLAMPPCLWGDPAEGLTSPVLLPLDAELLSIKRNNSTLAHTGDMALWQMRGVVVPKRPQSPTEPQGVSVETPLVLVEEPFKSAPTLRRRREEGA